MTDAPIVVAASPRNDQLGTAFRDLLKIAGAALATKGIIATTAVDPLANAVWVIGGAAMTVAPVIWSQLKTRANHAKLWLLAQFAPDSIGQAAPKP